jgi:hypothetical protein
MEFLDKDPYPPKPVGVIILGWVVAGIIIFDMVWYFMA